MCRFLEKKKVKRKLVRNKSKIYQGLTMSDTEYGPAGVGWSGTETNKLGPRDQLSQNQLPINQLLINQLPIYRLPTGSTPIKSTSHEINCNIILGSATKTSNCSLPVLQQIQSVSKPSKPAILSYVPWL